MPFNKFKLNSSFFTNWYSEGRGRRNWRILYPGPEGTRQLKRCADQVRYVAEATVSSRGLKAPGNWGSALFKERQIFTIPIPLTPFENGTILLYPTARKGGLAPIQASCGPKIRYPNIWTSVSEFRSWFLILDTCVWKKSSAIFVQQTGVPFQVFQNQINHTWAKA